jgi:hypothetical protein
MVTRAVLCRIKDQGAIDMNVVDRIRAGEYKSKVPWPKTPEKPVVLSKRVMDLSAADMANLAQVKARYDADMQTYREQKQLYSQSEQQGVAKLRDDLEREYGLSGHAKAGLLWSKAWEHGHSSGLEEVAHWYDDLSELVI